MMKMKKFLMLLTVAAIALMCFTGCGSAKITGITLDDITLEKGGERHPERRVCCR